MSGNLLGGSDFKKGAGQTSVIEIQLWRFHKPFAKVLVRRLEQVYDITLLEYRKPCSYGWLGDSALDCQRGLVEQLTNTSCA